MFDHFPTTVLTVQPSTVLEFSPVQCCTLISCYRNLSVEYICHHHGSNYCTTGQEIVAILQRKRMMAP